MAQAHRKPAVESSVRPIFRRPAGGQATSSMVILDDPNDTTGTGDRSYTFTPAQLRNWTGGKVKNIYVDVLCGASAGTAAFRLLVNSSVQQDMVTINTTIQAAGGFVTIKNPNIPNTIAISTGGSAFRIQRVTMTATFLEL